MFEALFVIVPIFIAVVFILVIAQIVSPKFRGKLMSRQIKATKYMMDEVKDDLTDLGTTMGNIGINVKKDILNQNEDTLKDLNIRQANIDKEGIEIRTRAIKDGITKGEGIYCKHCGTIIDKDSMFCKNCGGKQ